MMQKIKAFYDQLTRISKMFIDNIIFSFEINIEFLIRKDDIVLFLKAFLLSGIAFSGLKSFTRISPGFYTGAIVLVWLILLLDLNFEIRKNKSRIQEFLVSSFANIFAFLLWKSYANKEYISVCILILILYFFAVYVYSIMNSVSKEEGSEELFSYRKADLKKALDRLGIKNDEKNGNEKRGKEDSGNIIGIESPWGNGKTFFVQKLKAELGKENYAFVEIDVLAYNLDELPKVLVKELDKVLYENHIMSKFSSRLKDFFEKEKRLDVLYKLFGGKQYSYTETFHGFKSELKRINKTIVIIYEDIDRIIDRRLIKKIFYISEKLSCEKIKIIYQYSFKRLEEMKFDTIYVDKYIPYTITLSDVVLEDIKNSRGKLKNIITDHDLSIIDPEYFLTKMSSNPYLSWRRDEPLISVEKIHNFLQKRYNIRTINHFFDDMKELLDSGHMEEYIQRRTMVAFFFLKRFLPEAYKELAVRRNLEDCFSIKFEDKIYNFYDFHLFCTSKKSVITNEPAPFDPEILADTNELAAKRKKKVKDILNNSINIEKYIAYFIFDYEYYLDYISDTKAGINDEKIHLYNQQNKMIWNLLSPRESAKSDYQRIVDEVKRSIFTGKPASMEISTLNSEILRRVDREDNWWALYFAAFYIIGESEENWKKLIKRYWQRNFWTEFSPAFIKSAIGCMRYLDDKNFKYLMEKMNKLKIDGNLNKKKKFPEFLQSVLDRIYGDYLGSPRYRTNQELITEKILKQTDLTFFDTICQKIDAAIRLYEEQGDCGKLIHTGFIYKKTIKKIKQLISEKYAYNEHKPRPEKEDENYKRLLNCSDEEFREELKEVRKKYDAGTILNLLKNRKSNKEKKS